MARARNIKPGFFINEHLVELPFETRLLFAGLWTLADREGRLEDRPKKIKMAIFPADDVDVNQSLQELHDSGLIIRYVAENKGYIEVVTFTEHQNPHVKEAASVIPAPDKHCTNTVLATPLTSYLSLDSPIPQPTVEAEVVQDRMIPVNQLPVDELNVWLDAVAVATGAKDRRGLMKLRRWETVCMTAIREQHSIEKLLKIIKAELKRLGDEVHFFTPEACLQKLQASRTVKTERLQTPEERLAEPPPALFKPPPKQIQGVM